MADLEAFFEEVSHVEAEVKEKEHSSDHDDDDEAAAATTAEDSLETRPSKKQKPNPVIPKGVIVAAASVVKPAEPIEPSHPPSTETTGPLPHPAGPTSAAPSIPPPPPPRPSAPTPTAPSSTTRQSSQYRHAQHAPHDSSTTPRRMDTTGHSSIFVGNLGGETNEADLYHHFASRYPSTQHAQIMRNALGESKGYGFVQFSEALECARARRDMDQTWLGARPIRIKKYHGHAQATAGAGGKPKRKERTRK